MGTGDKTIRRLLPAISAILIGWGAMVRAQESTDSFPLAVGNYWIFRCYVLKPAGYIDPQHKLPAETIQMTWRSAIRQVVYRKNPGGLASSISAAFFDNSPRPVFGDLSLDDKGAPSILISVNSRRFYQISHWESAFPDVLRRVQDPDDNLSDLLRDTQILDLPLALGKGWGEPFFSWQVDRSEESPLTRVRGVGATSNRRGFVLKTSDNTAIGKFVFVPGIGITHVFTESLFPRGDASHWESDARLIEVHLNQKKAVGAQ